MTATDDDIAKLEEEQLADLTVAAMRAFEPLSSVLRYREKDQGGWHACDKMAMREAVRAIYAGIAPALIARLRAAEAERDQAREALTWYGEQARLARLIHREGDAGRHALSDDGGKRARTILSRIQKEASDEG